MDDRSHVQGGFDGIPSPKIRKVMKLANLILRNQDAIFIFLEYA
jgi:hypothetical protein